ncbi:MAG: PEP/pyruvate-binding domain-containing protein [Methanobacterium sp.]|nr:PEP/pyruvate-binding domain-containing protein [Methanobacterium sp.]
MDDITNYTINIKEKDLTIEKIGGKALNLSKLSSAGYNIPPAFIVSADAYDHFIKELKKEISTILNSINFNNENSISKGCSLIRNLIRSGKYLKIFF